MQYISAQSHWCPVGQTHEGTDSENTLSSFVNYKIHSLRVYTSLCRPIALDVVQVQESSIVYLVNQLHSTISKVTLIRIFLHKAETSKHLQSFTRQRPRILRAEHLLKRARSTCVRRRSLLLLVTYPSGINGSFIGECYY